MDKIISTICILAILIICSSCQKETHQVGSTNYGIILDNQQGSYSSQVSIHQETGYQRILRQSYKGTLIYPAPDEGSSPFFTQQAVDLTPKQIRLDGNKGKNYLVMISADWCLPCKRMYPTMAELKKQGYIVYIFDTTIEEFQDYAALYNTNAYPTFIIFDKGKETDRTLGMTQEKWFKDHLKVKEEQQVEVDNPYEGL